MRLGLQLLDLTHRLLGRRMLVFAVKAVEDVEANAHAYGPARQHVGHLIVVDAAAAHGHNLREVGRTLHAYTLLCQLLLERYLI